MNAYRKTLAAVIGAGVAWATLVLASNPTAVTGPEWVQGVVLLATALGVYALPNEIPA